MRLPALVGILLSPSHCCGSAWLKLWRNGAEKVVFPNPVTSSCWGDEWEASAKPKLGSAASEAAKLGHPKNSNLGLSTSHEKPGRQE